MGLDNNLEKTKERAEKTYKEIGKVFCPYFNEEIAFNSKGLKHIKFKKEKEARNRHDQYIRLKNIHLVPEIIKKSHTLQEARKERGFVQIKTNSRKEKILKDIRYYGFIAIIKERNFQKRLKIIVREVEGGQKHFWSIVPFWKNNKEIKLYSGNLETD